jgi:hypothetical protein
MASLLFRAADAGRAASCRAPGRRMVGTVSALREGNRHRRHQGEREGTMHCDVFLPSLPGPSLLSSALGWCCSQRAGALPLTPTKGSAPGPRLGRVP